MGGAQPIDEVGAAKHRYRGLSGGGASPDRGGSSAPGSLRLRGNPMNAAEKLYEECQQGLRQLQEECPHPEQTDWMEEWWAPGHSTDRTVKTRPSVSLMEL